jgi:hypothetical protein
MGPLETIPTMGWNNLHLFYHALNPMSKSILDSLARGTVMGKEIDVDTKLLHYMQDNNSQWHVEQSSTREVNALTAKNN